MTNTLLFLKYLAVMAVTTYLVRMLPLVLCKNKIQNRFVRSLLYYVPYAVLGAMTFPGIFMSTRNIISTAAGCLVAIFLGWKEKSLLTVAAATSAAVLIFELGFSIF